MGRHFLLVFGLSAAGALAQTDPAWWSNVIRSGDSHALENNYAPANLGQLKHFADKARLHLNSELDGGSGEAIETMVAGWTGSLDSGYEVANIGQLKAVADRFYARLDQVGVDYKTQLQNNGYNGVWTGVSGGYERPWDESAAPEMNYAPANLGQLKILFSFDLTGFSPSGDDDGLPNVWEIAHGLDPHNSDQNHNGVLDGLDDFDGDGVSNAQELLDGTDPFDANSALNPPGATNDMNNLTALALWTPLN